MGRIGGGRIHFGLVEFSAENANRAMIALSAIAVIWVLVAAFKHKYTNPSMATLAASISLLLCTILMEVATSIYAPGASAAYNFFQAVYLYIAWIVPFEVFRKASLRATGAKPLSQKLDLIAVYFVYFYIAALVICLIALVVMAVQIEYMIPGLFGLSMFIVYGQWVMVAVFLVLAWYHRRGIDRFGWLLLYGTILFAATLAQSVTIYVVYDYETAIALQIVYFVFNELLVVLGFYIAATLGHHWIPAQENTIGTVTVYEERQEATKISGPGAV
ncbi:hypothetical protein DFQ28_006625 [Apophysomyces sp. BC1034]|nr:hypothetical protein DFQ30_003362 [Apophysomyces sp. BC1015]KAG0182990.1 hypothetical protein DFQ29_000801 [Apophysomyces sp. BC1021]KAG0194776.1 hypothetical protein DFQ28_006625 [Apophysomyces sp. BC1034]